jgi:hypothetical protein
MNNPEFSMGKYLNRPEEVDARLYQEKYVNDVLGGKNGVNLNRVHNPEIEKYRSSTKTKEPSLNQLIKKFGLEGKSTAEIKEVLTKRLANLESVPQLVKDFMSGDEEALKTIQGIAGGPTPSHPPTPSLPHSTPHPPTPHIPNAPKSLLGKYGNILKVGAVLGAVDAMTDTKDDNAFTTAGKMVGGTALAGSAYAAWKLGGPLMKDTTVGTMMRDKVHALGSDIVDEATEIARGKRVQRGVGLGFKIYAGVIAVGTVADIGLRLHNHAEEKNMEHRQEKALKKAQKEDRKSYAQTRASYMDYGQIAMDLFNNRTGHYKMGNAKFN